VSPYSSVKIGGPPAGPLASRDVSVEAALTAGTLLTDERSSWWRTRPTPQRVRRAHVEWVGERLGERDRAILNSVARLRLLSGSQLERLHFSDVSSSARARVRRRVLARLVSWRVLLTLERRIGGVRAGSSGLVFALDSAGQWLASAASGRHRTEPPGGLFVAHQLKVAELYVSLVERARQDEAVTLGEFMAEPASWWPNGLGGWLKPDAYLSLKADGVTDAWWLEQDMSTERLPTIQRKLRAYLDFAARGQVGPTGVMPRVLLSVPDDARQDAIGELIARLPYPADELLYVTTAARAASFLLAVLRSA
jgi:Replication-relaxation